MKEMKTLYKTILAVCAFCFLLPSAFAQNLAPGTYEVTNGIAYNKSVTGPNSDGSYTVKIETFVAGNVTSYNNKPADIVLVLDVSGSMAWPKGTVTRTSKTSLSYNDVAKGDKDYFISYGSYTEQIFAEKYGNNYYLYVSPDEQTSVNSGKGAYLQANWSGYYNGETTSYRNYAASASSPDDPIVGIYNVAIYEGKSRISALKSAVNTFITAIDKNDRLDSFGEDRDGGVLKNQISIIKFAGDKRSYVGNETYYQSSGTRANNYTQVVVSPTRLNEDDGTSNVLSLQNTVATFIPRGGTNAEDGLDLALTELNTLAKSRPESSKTVVFFTDGSPDDDDYASVIKKSNSIKNAKYDVNLFAVSVFTSTDNNNTRKAYMERTSSNYKNATNYNNGNKTGDGFYMDATADDVSLDEIFTKIAQASGGSANDKINEGSITALDIVSASFTIPSGTDVNKIVISTEKCTGEKDGYLQFSDRKVAPSRQPIVNYRYFDKDKNDYVTIPSFDVDANVHYDRDETNNSISVSGFDFVKCFCGHDVQLGYVGYKLILEFPITVKEDAVGGAGTATNLPGSGIYLKNADGTRGDNLVVFNQPSVNMPTNLWIQKSGLSKGESALFTVQRIPTSYVNKTKVNNVYQYQVTDENKWEDYTTVLITGAVDSEGKLLSPMAKLTGLSSDYYYRVIEADADHKSWSWSYDSTAGTAVETFNIDHNPIQFSNHKNEKSQGKHYAESKAINYFGKAKDQETINSREHFTNKNQSE